MIRHVRLLLVACALLIGAAVWAAAAVERHSADVARDREQQGQLLLTGMLDQETGLRGFVITGREEFLDPYRDGHSEYAGALRTLRRDTDSQERRLLDSADAIARQWQAAAVDTIAEIRRGDRSAVTQEPDARKAIFDRFRVAHADLLARLETRRHDSGRTAAIVSALVALLIALLVGIAGDTVIRRRDRADRERRDREERYRAGQTQFADALLLSENEAEAQDLLRRHLERTISETQIVVLKRNNSADRLEPATRVDDAGIAERLDGAQPRSCLAVRLGRPHDRAVGATELMSCEICGKAAGSSMCKPLLVGSEVIGSVLAISPRELGADDDRCMHESVAQAAPTLANLRNLALAEARAATDALTGLPNRRAIEDTLKRMVAQASRTVQPLSALMIDLDHFKTINDLYGHEGGDAALAAVGALLTGMV
ncbi:MAG TPA: diguanylate cyclase, partial [Solirubrobacteraceae bacterium]|nr:diguanylate cyclase [Solirubrobacteraceae bacterium]